MNDDSFIGAAEPDEWTVVFHRKAVNRLFSLIALGHFKHVSAFGYVAGLKIWVVYDVQFTHTAIALLPHCDETVRALVAHCSDAATVKMRRAGGYRCGLRLGFWCVPAIKHLLGLRCGALRPDALWLHCRKHGSEIIDGRRRHDHPAGAGLSAASAGPAD